MVSGNSTCSPAQRPARGQVQEARGGGRRGVGREHDSIDTTPVLRPRPASLPGGGARGHLLLVLKPVLVTQLGDTHGRAALGSRSLAPARADCVGCLLASLGTARALLAHRRTWRRESAVRQAHSASRRSRTRRARPARLRRRRCRSSGRGWTRLGRRVSAPARVGLEDDHIQRLGPRRRCVTKRREFNCWSCIAPMAVAALCSIFTPPWLSSRARRHAVSCDASASAAARARPVRGRVDASQACPYSSPVVAGATRHSHSLGNATLRVTRRRALPGARPRSRRGGTARPVADARTRGAGPARR